MNKYRMTMLPVQMHSTTNIVINDTLGFIRLYWITELTKLKIVYEANI